ncbi:MAG: hypothetical protein NWE89_07275 [Candidatus Bathyarchaeota archaeon]|nr:hypothetical protein [Candidatus Bathyarchaeota archaeon]
MNEFYTLALRMINGLITVFFFPLIYRSYRKTGKRFYLLWGVGYFLYGIGIVIIAFLQLLYNEVSLGVEVVFFVFSLIGFSLVLTGVGDLFDKAKLVFFSSLSVPLIIVILYFTTQPRLLGSLVALTPYFFITFALAVIKKYYNPPIEMFVIGWTILSLANIGLLLGSIEPFFVEVIAIFAKIIIINGVLYQRFSFLADDLTRYLISGSPIEYYEAKNGKIALINASKASKIEEITWIKRRAKENHLKEIRTILVSMYDLISLSDLRQNGVGEDDLYYVRMIQGLVKTQPVFDEQTMTINDDLTDLNQFIMDVIQFSNERRINCQIIIYTLSSLIHTHGWKRVYSFLLPKITQIKTSLTDLYILYYPNTHSNTSDIVKFERISDEVNDIKKG